ncbi:ABC-2 type transport system permease protein [Paenibacillus cellulosilyticus]|uniref:ABC-2 type transport system permease protein n=1 Tax=Paenibacillus cellulosilyticus TaxID=375489 RepID=A0A2V2YWE7_9BACL|nr:ABC transporter permease [Paenibacillus cellulosilyticus]PWW06138.1 ABC-2 type transport system permease protein [Paenibacillus cellulosilyticus]QKS43092.1 ABC transporter permease [Paenibacillus cellulosilyticus]
MKIGALALRIIQQFVRDRRTLALLFVAPLFVLTLMKLVFDGQNVAPDIGVVELPSTVTEQLTSADADLDTYTSIDNAMADLRGGKLDAVLAFQDGKPSLTLEGSDPTMNKAVLLLIQNTLRNQVNRDATPVVTYLHGTANMASFDSFGPVLIGFFSFFFVFLLAGVSFLRERTSGTLERLLATPIRRHEIVAGYLAGFGLFALLQATLIAAYSVKVLDMYMVGSIGYMLLINLLLALTALTLGTLLSSFASTEFQIIQFIPIVIVPQAFFSGLFNLEAMNPWLQKLSHIMPLYYGADAMRGIMIRGEGWGDWSVDVYVLLGFSALFALLNVLALRKHRRL